MYTLVIIGAGFSGTATAIQLLRQYGDLPLNLVLVEARPEPGRGLAYGTRSPAHRLNVPAGRMSLFPEDDGDFLRYARTRDAEIGGGSFVPRALYGDYLALRLEEAAAHASRARLQLLNDTVVDLHLKADGRHAVVELAQGGALEAERVVLALGNTAPLDPPSLDAEFVTSPRYVRDPWAPGAFERVDRDAPVLLVGTGLTMVDVALELKRRGHGEQLYALSRRGLLPQAHRHQLGVALEPSVVINLLRKGPARVSRYLRVLRLCVADLAEAGIDWRDVIGALRPYTAELWQALNASERRRFLRHLQPYWDTHRHRFAPAVHEDLQALMRDGGLVVQAGRLQALTVKQDQVQVRWRPRRARKDVRLEVGTVINCTGPHSRLTKLADPLVQSLLRQGLLVPDALELGVQADADGALLDRARTASERLFYIGPLLRARDWEYTAVPELRAGAARLAGRLVEPLTIRQARTGSG